MTARDLTYEKLEAITNKFSEVNKVGSGGFGEVYKGVLDDGTEIAVKKLHHMVGLDDVQFKKEFNNLMKIQHKNIIRLIAYCYEVRHKHLKVDQDYVFAKSKERALCFEYFKRGSLENCLSEESCGLDWNTRYKIIKGVCEGLDYLHNGSENAMRMYHLDLKPGNILLDENFVPKIADFGLSRLFGDSQTHITKQIMGTFGYLPPEYIQKRQISKKFDVFSLGIIIIKIMAGPSGHSKSAEVPPEQFIEDVKENWKKRLLATSDTLISQEADNLEVATCIEIALRSVEADREKRPTIREIVDKLNEIESVRQSLTGQNSQCKLERLAIDPLEVRFPFKLGMDVSCVLQLTNRSPDFVAFNAQVVEQSMYRTEPDNGVLPPWSKRYMYIMATLQAQGNPPARRNDMVIIKSAKAVVNQEGSTTVAEDEAVEEARLPVVFVPLPPPPARLI